MKVKKADSIRAFFRECDKEVFEEMMNYFILLQIERRMAGGKWNVKRLHDVLEFSWDQNLIGSYKVHFLAVTPGLADNDLVKRLREDLNDALTAVRSKVTVEFTRALS